jgi:Fe-S-cluster-containing dehydrogenase component/DMSO reductase anchor subunit
MHLPLVDRAKHDGVTYVLTPRRKAAGAPATGATPRTSLAERMPKRPLEPGEQYRFHVDMGACIGCKCCVVACNEQNGNPSDINWRRVAEMESGVYPDARRSFLSMGCNHCLDPTCLKGCPVDAYSKDPVTGIVRHSADTCIGCQYCTWNCSYGVPQFNPERGVVGKCDMCHGRLESGQSPACVSACPEGAIQIEIVNVASWKQDYARQTTLSGVPVGDDSVGTTRVTVPDRVSVEARPVDLTHVRPEHPHWPLVVMTVLTQLAVGAFLAIWLSEIRGIPVDLEMAALTSLIVGGLALGASTLHLGRPVHAYRALKMWRRSWLSREVLLFSAFSGVAALYAGCLWFGWSPSPIVGLVTALAGVAGVTATAYIYRVPSRLARDTPLTLLQFAGTALVLGPLFAMTTGGDAAAWLRLPAVAAGCVLGLLVAVSFLRAVASDRVELRGTARLLSTELAKVFVLRGTLLVVGSIVLPLATTGPTWSAAALVIALSGEITARYLFFVSVVPAHMAAPYLAISREAA